MTYSNEEIQAAVERLVKSSVQKETDSFGRRVAETQYDDVRELAASIFITYPDAPYYVISLGMRRAKKRVETLVSTLNHLTLLIESLGRRGWSGGSEQGVSGALVAVSNLELALMERGVHGEVQGLPAYLQWESASLKYLQEVGEGVKLSGGVTPEQAKAEVWAAIRQVKEEFAQVVLLQQSLKGAMADFAGLSLEATAVRNVVSRVRAVLTQDKEDLAALSVSAQQALAREKTLNIVSARAVISSYGGEPPQFRGELLPYSDENHEATPAMVRGTLAGPYPLVSYPVGKGQPPDSRDNNVLTFALEGGKSVTLTMPTSFVAFMLGSGKPQPQPAYDPANPINAADPADPNVTFTFYGDGEELGKSPTYCAQKIPTQQPGTGSPKGARYCESFTNEEDKENQWFFPDANSDFYIEQYIEGVSTRVYHIPLIRKGSDPATIFEYPDPGLVPPYPACRDWSGYKVKLTLQQVVDRINAVLIGANSYLRAYASATGGLEIRGMDPLACVRDRLVGVRIPRVVQGGIERNTAAQAPLGFVLGMDMLSRRVSALAIVDFVNGNTSKVAASLVSTPPVASMQNMRAWTNQTDKSQVVLAKYTGVGAVTSAGAALLFTALQGDLAALGVSVGDVVCLPKQYVKDGTTFVQMGDAGGRYRVTAVTSKTLTAAHVSGPVAETYPLRMLDVGSAEVLTHVQPYMVVQVHTAPNDGAFEIQTVDSLSPFRVTFAKFLSQNKQANEALPLELSVTVGPASCAFASVDATTASSIAVTGTMRPLVFPTVPSARGSTPYVRVPSDRPALVVGDSFILHGSSDTQVKVKAVEDLVATIDVAVPCESNWTFSVRPGVSHVQGSKRSTESVVQALAEWENASAQDVAVVSQNLEAKVNALALSPSMVHVADAKALVAELEEKASRLEELFTVQEAPLPDEATTGFYAPVVPAVDDLLVALRAKSCTRAVDVLLAGKFQEFFALGVDDLSHTGALLAAARSVAQNDLATTQFGTSAVRRRVLGAEEGTDPDYDFADSDGLSYAPDVSAGCDLPSAPDMV